MIARTLKAPYYAVIFTTLRTKIDEGYSEMAEKMEELAKDQDGYLGIESARNELGITISYWRLKIGKIMLNIRWLVNQVKKNGTNNLKFEFVKQSMIIRLKLNFLN